MKIQIGISHYEVITLCADVNGDGEIGIQEMIYIMQIVAGLRSK